MFCCFSVHLSALSWSPETCQLHRFLQIPPFRSLASLMGGIYLISRFTPVYLSVPATVSHDTSPEPLCFIPFCRSTPGLSSYFWGIMLLCFSSCCLFFFFFPCLSILPSFRTPLLVLIALFLTAAVFLPLRDIIYQSPLLFHFLIPPHLVLSLLSHWNPSLTSTNRLAVHRLCYSGLSFFCSFYSDCRSSNFPCRPLSELLHPAVTPHFISPCYPWQGSAPCLLSSFQPLSSSGCSFGRSSFLLAVSCLFLYSPTLHTICCAAASMTHPENNKNPTTSPSTTLGSRRRHSCIQNLHQQQTSQDPPGIQVHNFCLNQ